MWDDTYFRSAGTWTATSTEITYHATCVDGAEASVTFSVNYSISGSTLTVNDTTSGHVYRDVYQRIY